MTEPRGLSDLNRKESGVTSPAVAGGMEAFNVISFIEAAVELIGWLMFEVILPILSLLV